MLKLLSKKFTGHNYVNAGRSKEERRARYCFLRHFCGFNRSMTRRLAGWSDNHVIQFLDAWNFQKENEAWAKEHNTNA